MRLSLITLAAVAAVIALNICETDACCPGEVPLEECWNSMGSGRSGLHDRFSIGMSGDEDLGEDIKKKDVKVMIRSLEADRFIPLPPGRVQKSGK